MAAITWTDELGSALLRSSAPAPGDRCMTWVPVKRGAGPVEAAMDGGTDSFIYRTDYGATFELRRIAGRPAANVVPAGSSPAWLAVRLADWLNRGGAVTLPVENAAGDTYACDTIPGATHAPPDCTDADALLFRASYHLRSRDGTPMPYPY